MRPPSCSHVAASVSRRDECSIEELFEAMDLPWDGCESQPHSCGMTYGWDWVRSLELYLSSHLSSKVWESVQYCGLYDQEN